LPSVTPAQPAGGTATRTRWCLPRCPWFAAKQKCPCYGHASQSALLAPGLARGNAPVAARHGRSAGCRRHGCCASGARASEGSG
jgi:hypothetical protein